jgi:hypothetical protein
MTDACPAVVVRLLVASDQVVLDPDGLLFTDPPRWWRLGIHFHVDVVPLHTFLGLKRDQDR